MSKYDENSTMKAEQKTQERLKKESAPIPFF